MKILTVSLSEREHGGTGILVKVIFDNQETIPAIWDSITLKRVGRIRHMWLNDTLLNALERDPDNARDSIEQLKNMLENYGHGD